MVILDIRKIKNNRCTNTENHVLMSPLFRFPTKVLKYLYSTCLTTANTCKAVILALSSYYLMDILLVCVFKMNSRICISGISYFQCFFFYKL